MRNKNLLIVDCLDVYNPLLFSAAKRCGLNTLVLGRKPRIDYEHIDHYYQCEEWHNDEAIFGTVAQIVEKHKVDNVITFEELSIQLTARIAHKFGFKGHSVDAANNARNKYLMRRAFEARQVPCPKFQLIRSETELKDVAIPFPLVVKPLCGSGSMGVCKVSTPDELTRHFEKVTRIARALPIRASDEHNQDDRNAVLVEEFADGREVCMEALTYKGVTKVVIIQDEPYKSGPYFAETAFVTPSTLPSDIQDAIRETAARAVSALGITSGPSHIEMTITKSGPVVIEIGARVGGHGYFHNAVYYSTGIDYLKEIYRVAFGLPPALESTQEYVVGDFFLRARPGKSGTIVKMHGIDEISRINEVKYVLVVAKPGDRVDPLPHGGRAGGACGSVFVQSKTREEIDRVFAKIDKLFRVDLAEDPPND